MENIDQLGQVEGKTINELCTFLKPRCDFQHFRDTVTTSCFKIIKTLGFSEMRDSTSVYM